MSYNATVHETYTDPATGETVACGTFTADALVISGRLQMLRSNWISCTGYEGHLATLKEDLRHGQAGEEVATYDLYLRMAHPNSDFRVVLDNCAGYKARLAGLDLPPTYR